MATNLDLAQLRAMSESMRRQGKHPPFGFYGGIVVDKTQVTIGNDRHDVCAGPVVIDVTMVLAAPIRKCASALTVNEAMTAG